MRIIVLTILTPFFLIAYICYIISEIGKKMRGLIIQDDPERRDSDYEEFKQSLIQKYGKDSLVAEQFKGHNRRKDDEK